MAVDRPPAPELTTSTSHETLSIGPDQSRVADSRPQAEIVWIFYPRSTGDIPGHVEEKPDDFRPEWQDSSLRGSWGLQWTLVGSSFSRSNST
jgi:hypothetical protein